jgi:RNA polymerase sigma-70 factor (ECF subfamily)
LPQRALPPMSSDNKALVEQLFREHGSALKGYLYRQTGNEQDANELVQETYLRMLQIKDMDAVRDCRAYMFTIAGNLAKKHGREQGRERGTVDVNDATLEAELSYHPSFGDQIDDEEHLRRLREVFAELPVKCRAAYILQTAHGLSYAEIAQQLGVSTDMVKKYLSQTLLHCRRRMGGRNG